MWERACWAEFLPNDPGDYISKRELWELSVRLVTSAVLGFRTAGLLAVAVPAALMTVAGLSVAQPIGSVTPNPSAPGTVTTFRVTCAPSATSATFFAFTLGLHDQIPMRVDAAGKAGQFEVTVKLPVTLAAGIYQPTISCSNATSTTVRLRVNQVPRKPPPTGDGTTATATGSPLALAGYALIGLGVLAGGLALRRRGGRTGQGQA